MDQTEQMLPGDVNVFVAASKYLIGQCYKDLRSMVSKQKA